MTTKLTPEQEEYLPKHLDKWISIGRRAEPAIRPTAEKAIKVLYKEAEQKVPRTVVWFDSPYQGAIAAALLSVVDKKGKNFKKNLEASVKAIAEGDVEKAPMKDLWEKAREQFNSQLYQAGYGQHDYWVGWLKFGEYIGADLQKNTLDAFSDLAQSCGWWWAFDGAIILTERPVRVSVDDEGRLHHESQMAIEYPDGWGLFTWHGIRVADDIILHPEEITVDQIDKEENAEIRRILLERFGDERFLREGNATLIQEDECGKLWKRDVEGDETIAMVQVKDHSTDREYFLRVPPGTNRAKEGIAWTFDQDEKEYNPSAQT